MNDSQKIIPLQKSDVRNFDTIPDDVLWLSELQDNGKLEEFIRRFLVTPGKESADFYIAAMDYSLWEELRKRLVQLSQNKDTFQRLAPEEQERIKGWLNHEFSDRRIGVGYFSFLSRSRTKRNVRQDFPGGTKQTSQIEQKQDSFGHGVTVSGNQLFRDWKFFETLKLTYNPAWGDTTNQTQLQSSLGSVERESVRTRRRMDVQQIAPTFSMLRLGGRFQLGLKYELTEYENPLPDFLARKDLLNGSLFFQRPAENWPISFQSSVDMKREENSSSEIPGAQKRRSFTLPINSEFTYQMRDAWGLVVAHTYTRTDEEGYYSLRKSSANNISLLNQFATDKKGSVRFGAGGGWDQYDNERTDRREKMTGQGRSGHGLGSLRWNFLDGLLSTDTSLLGVGQYLEGSLTGWYPSWELGQAVTLQPDSLLLSASAGWSGYRRHLFYRNLPENDIPVSEGEKYQRDDTLKATTEVNWTPLDILEMTGTAVYLQTWEGGFRPSN